jgi:selenocysteine lyase/cysteine desulfurase
MTDMPKKNLSVDGPPPVSRQAALHPAETKLPRYYTGGEVDMTIGQNIQALVGNALAFPILRHWHFFNHAGVSPLPHAASEALRTFADQAERQAYLGSNWYHDVESLRIAAADLINAHRDEIAFVKNTSEGISIVANGIDWQWGDRVVTTAIEYPANIYPWMEQVRTRGIKLIMVPEEVDEAGRRFVPLAKILEEAKDPKTKVVTISHVEFASGQRHDLAALGAFCRENKIFFCVDAIQSLGVLPLDVVAMNIDYLSADGHKWLLGPEGAGIFYCRRELIERTRPLMVGWMNVVDAQNYGAYDYTLRADAGRFECGSHNVAGLLSLKASLDMLREVGVDAVSQRLKLLTDRLILGVMMKGYQVVSPRKGFDWSGIVSFVSPTHNHQEIILRLRKQHQTEIAFREGRLRASPHFYNTEAQIDRLIGGLPEH